MTSSREAFRRYYSCTRKFVHRNYWSAMQHASRVQAMHLGSIVAIYPCRYCDGLHVGKALIEGKFIHSFTKLEKMMEHPHFWQNAPKEVQDRFVIAREEMALLISLSPALQERCQVSREARDISSS